MKSSVTIMLLIILSAIYVHAAEIEEISLTSLQGTYSAENLFDTDVRTAAFVFVGTPTDIHSVRIRICGESFPSFYMCDWWPKEAAWRLDYKATFYDTISGGYLEAFVETSNSMEVLSSEEFVVEGIFTSYSEGTWNFLLSGAGEIQFVAMPHAYPYSHSCFGYPGPSAAISEVTLIIDADFIVSAESYSWGAIKSLFEK